MFYVVFHCCRNPNFTSFIFYHPSFNDKHYLTSLFFVFVYYDMRHNNRIFQVLFNEKSCRVSTFSLI